MNMKTIKELRTVADNLYDSGLDSQSHWLEAFTPVELAKLWHETCQITKANPFGACYDDEVFNALNSLGYYD